MSAADQTDDEITLLVGFDAMREFIEVHWRNYGEKSDDLATFLSNIDRGAADSCPPLDRAQWSDWLDAIAIVRPDLKDVQDARGRIQSEHNEFIQILEIAKSEERKEKIEEFNDRKGPRTWHIIGHKIVKLMDAYEAMREFVLAYWNRGMMQSKAIEDIVAILGERGEVPSVAEWDAWKTAILKVSKKEKEPLLGLTIPSRA